MSGGFDNLRGLFGRREPAPERKKRVAEGRGKPPADVSPSKSRTKSKSPAKGPSGQSAKSSTKSTSQVRNLEHLIVVGLDFGTAYTKCVVRDALVRDPGKAYPVP